MALPTGAFSHLRPAKARSAHGARCSSHPIRKSLPRGHRFLQPDADLREPIPREVAEYPERLNVREHLLAPR